MKLIERIQSFSDIITNSSSEIFITQGIPNLTSEGKESGCITIEPIGIAWIACNIKWEDDAIEQALDSLGLEGKALVNNYPESREIIEKALDGCYFIDIENHYDSESYYKDVNSASDKCLYYDCRY